MVIFAVDLGDARTGTAVSDKNEVLASPVKMLPGADTARLAADIAQLCTQYGAERIVLGLPKNMDGTEGDRAQKSRDFAEELRLATGLEVVLYDERLTTVSAHKIMNITDTRGKKRKANVDNLSAVLILEDYMTRRKSEA